MKVWPLTWTFPELFPNFRRPLITFGQGHMWFLKNHFTSLAEIMSLMAQEQKHRSVFSGVWQAWDSSVQHPPGPPSPGLSRCSRHWCIWGVLEPKKWMCIKLRFHIRGQTKKTHRSKGTRKRKKSSHYPQNVFLNICFSCAAVWPDSSIEEQTI